MPQWQPSPIIGRVGSHIASFEGSSAVSLSFRPACSRDRLAVLYIEGSNGFVTSTIAPITSGWSDELPGGAFTRWNTNTFPGAPVIGS